MLACIFDGYVDEPACLGVPPTLSPYPRYLAGALDELGWEYVYITVDEWRLARGDAAALRRGGGRNDVRPGKRRGIGRGGDGRGGSGRHGSEGDGGGRSGGGARGIGGRRGDGRGGDGMRGRPLHWSRSDAQAKWERARKADALVALWGALVPGKYLSATPASPRELTELTFSFAGQKYLGGPGAAALAGFSPETGRAYHTVLEGDADAVLYDIIRNGSGPAEEGIAGGGDSGEGGGGRGARGRPRRRTPAQRERWAARGAALARQHPDAGGQLLAEVESYRGCVRYISGGCSFCSDVSFGEPAFREPAEVAAEAGALEGAGVKNIRVGGQTCIFSYMAKGVGMSEAPEPDPAKVKALFGGINRAAPGLEVLHTDNANPAVIAAHPEKARDAADALVEHCTSGNTVALGLESADPKVKEANNLNASPEDAMTAIRVINEAGGERGESGLPNLLPGVNFVTGLAGETKRTLELDKRFLQGILDSGHLVRRVNVRRALMPGTRTPAPSRIHASLRHWTGEVFEPVMLERLVPDGTVIRGVFMERTRGNTTFGRQAGGYPLLVGLPYPVDIGRRLDVAITSRGSRSVGGVQVPLPVNEASQAALSALPGIGKKRAASIFRARPIRDAAHLGEVLDSEELGVELIRYIQL